MPRENCFTKLLDIGMCGRFSQYTLRKELAETFQVTAQFDLPGSSRYNIAPTQTATAVRASLDGEREFAQMRWGLIPHWARDAQIGNQTFNARAETLRARPTFRELFQRRRVLIPTDAVLRVAEAGYAQAAALLLHGGQATVRLCGPLGLLARR